MRELFEGEINFLQLKQAFVCGVNSKAWRTKEIRYLSYQENFIHTRLTVDTGDFFSTVWTEHEAVYKPTGFSSDL